MQRVRHALPAALIAAAIVAGTAACDSTAKSTGSPDPLARLTAAQISERAIADLNEATSVRFAGTGTKSGAPFTLAFTLVRGHGCQGSISQRGKVALRMVYDGKSVWMLPSESFYRSQSLNPAALSQLSGKWLKLPQSNMSNWSSFCSLSGWVRQLSGHYAEMTKGKVTTVDGRRVVALHQTGITGTVDISDTAKPEILKATVSKGSTTGTFTFSDYGVPTTFTPPPASKTLDGSKFGF
jgi:hypothetical protein